MRWRSVRENWGVSAARANAVANARPKRHRCGVIASIAFRKFKALRNTRVTLKPFNVVIGPNGSGKTSLIEAVLQLRALSQLPVSVGTVTHKPGEAEIEFGFGPPHEGLVARLGCVSDTVCDSLRLQPAVPADWPALKAELATIRGYVLDHEAMAQPAQRDTGAELVGDGANLAAVLADMRSRAPESYSALVEEMLRITSEFRSLELLEHKDGRVEFSLRLAEDGVVPAAELSQGMLYLLGVLALAYDPDPPWVLCIEEIDRGIHPRTLREIRDALYRLSYPESYGRTQHAVQIIVTTHSPYFIDLFRDHPEEVIISQKHGRAAHFERLSDRRDLPELLKEGSLGDMWFSGILGGVPEERDERG